MRDFIPLALLALFACRGADVDTDDLPEQNDSDTDTDDTDDTNVDPVVCTASLASIDPSPDEFDVPVNAVVHATFTEPVGSDDWSLGITGVAGTAHMSDDGRHVSFEPAGPLSTERDYQIEYSVCDTAGSTIFRTVTGPLPPNVLEGRTYVIAWDELGWTAPPGASLFSSQVDWADDVLVQVISVDPVTQTIELGGALGLRNSAGDSAQAACVTPLDYGVSDFASNPVFQVGPNDMLIPTEAGDVTLSDVFVEATFAPDGESIRDIEVSANLDTRPLDAMLSMDICGLLGTVADVCELCADGADKCLPVVMTAAEGIWQPGLDLDVAYEPDLDSACIDD